MKSEIARILKDEDDFLIVTHINPDGDAVGSLLGMFLALREMGKKAWAVSGEKFPEMYGFLPSSSEVVTGVESLGGKPRWILSVDVAAENRVSGEIKEFRPEARLVVIDHHPTNPGFGDLNLIEPAATSTAEIVFSLLKECGYTLSPEVGKCLYTGLITDTGCFRFSGVTSRTMRLAAEMMAPGFDSYAVTRFLYEEYPFSRFQLERLMLERIEMLLEGRLSLSTLYDKDFEHIGADHSDSENLVNRLREIRGVEVAVLMTQMSDGLIRVSLRSKNELDVAVIAKSLGGGGHRRASGLRSDAPLARIRKQIIEAVAAGLA